MKTLSFLFAVCLLGWGLSESNPKAKDRYVEQVARDFQSRCCAASAASSSDDCIRLRPITQPMMRVIVNFYTDAPKDHLFFTRYTTRLPHQTIYGIGVAGQVMSWRMRLATENPATFFTIACGQTHCRIALDVTGA